MLWKNIINLNELQFERDDPKYNYETDPRGFSSVMGAKKLGWNISRIPPGEISCPYHFHYSEEELFLVISGTATLRQSNRFREVKKGDLIFFSSDAEGAHQFYNHGEEWFAYLALSTLDPLDLAEFPDSGKISVRNANVRKVFELASAVPYFKGEENPLKNWPSEIVRKA
jgi:uncharacterized cupin superfamily protein